jgi:thiol-disulfide isomerase/thioredoxin
MHSEAGTAGRELPRRAVLRGGAALAWLLTGGLFAARAEARSLRVGEPAPPAVLITLGGERIDSRDLRGRVVILTFWATYCVPCRTELPLLSDYAAAHAGDGLSVLGFCLDEPDQASAVRRVADSLKFPVGFMREDSAPGYGRIWRLPVSFTIDRAGLLVENGWAQKEPAWTAQHLERVVSPLLASDSSAR